MSDGPLLSHLVGSPWLILDSALQTIIEVAQRAPVDPDRLAEWKGLMAQPQREAVAFRMGDPLPGARRARLRDGVAIIPVLGPIFRRANLMTDLSGATALGDIAADLRLAQDDSRVRAVLLEIDSPGGHATGISEMAAALRALGQVKPVAAYVDGVAASAAYWLASAAGDVVLSPTAMVGSLGAVLAFPPRKAGEPEPLEIVSSQTPNKRSNPHTEPGRAQLQALIDDLAAVFLTDAAAYRGMSVDDLLAATNGGGLVLGQKAVEGGLADRLGDFESLLASLSAPRPGPSAPARMSHPIKEPIAMTEPETTKPVDDSAPPAAAAVPPVIEGAQPRVLLDPVAAERARVGAIMAAQRPGFHLMATLAVNHGWTPEAFLAAQDAAKPAIDAAATGGFKATLPKPVETADAQGPAQTPEQKMQAAWDADPALQAEFGGRFSSYAAWCKAEAEGRARRVSRA